MRPTISSARPAARSRRSDPSCSYSSTPRSGQTSSGRRARPGSGSPSRTGGSIPTRWRATASSSARSRMRSDEEAERVLALGAAPDRVWVTGNTKFDALVLDGAAGREEALRVEMGIDARRPVLMAGSTHEGEEELLLAVHARLRGRHPGLQLVIAPRYVERAGRIMALAAEAGLPVRLRSGGVAAGHAEVIVLDTIGELAAAYRLATLVFVGGSFVTRGGQNVLEPAAQ